MKRNSVHLMFTLFSLVLLAQGADAANWTADMKEGKPAFQSMGPLAEN